MRERVRACLYVMGITLVISVLVWQLTGRVFLLLTVTFVMAMVYWAVSLMKADADR